MNNPWLIAIVSGVVSPMILGLLSILLIHRDRLVSLLNGINKKQFEQKNEEIERQFSGITEYIDNKMQEANDRLSQVVTKPDYETNNRLIQERIQGQFSDITQYINNKTQETTDQLSQMITKQNNALLQEEFEQKLIEIKNTLSSIHIESGIKPIPDKLRGQEFKMVDNSTNSGSTPSNLPDYYDIKIDYNGYTFAKQPKVVFGISLLDAQIWDREEQGNIGVRNLRLFTEIKKTEKDHFVVQVRTSWDSFIHEASINWIAYTNG